MTYSFLAAQQAPHHAFCAVWRAIATGLFSPSMSGAGVRIATNAAGSMLRRVFRGARVHGWVERTAAHFRLQRQNLWIAAAFIAEPAVQPADSTQGSMPSS
jgi:hypothetical protein